MSIGLLGYKIGMTQLFDQFGNANPVTLLKMGPCVITQIKTIQGEGYNSIQIGYKNVPYKVLTQSQLGHLKKSNIQPLKHLKEFHVKDPNKFKIGQLLTTNLFKEGQIITIKGKSIGKGFSGVQKRHNFKRGPMTHGSKNHRAPGSIGMGTTPGRVLPGKKMAGQLGNINTEIKNLPILQINSNEDIIVVKGSVPGKSGNLLSINLRE